MNEVRIFETLHLVSIECFLTLCTLFEKSNFCPKIQFLIKLYSSTYLNFCAKIGRFFEYFILKTCRIFEFSYQKSRFLPKIELTKHRKKSILTNFRAKIRNVENLNFSHLYWGGVEGSNAHFATFSKSRNKSLWSGNAKLFW